LKSRSAYPASIFTNHRGIYRWRRSPTQTCDHCRAEINAAKENPTPKAATPKAAHSRFVTSIVVTAPKQPKRLGHPPSTMPAATNATNRLPGA
jgi:hypothetical protein